MNNIINPFEQIQTQIEELKSLLIETREILENKKSDTDILTINDLVAYTGYSKSHIYKMVSCNEIPFTKKGSKLFFSRNQIKDWLFETRKMI